MTNKRSQVSGQVLMVILTLFMIGFVVLFGTKMIGGLTQQSDKVNYVKFKNTLQNEINSITQEYKSKIQIDLLMPKGFEEICIVDLAKDPNGDLDGDGVYDNIKEDYPVMYNYWNDYMGDTSKEKRNVFLISKFTEATFYVDKIEIEDGFICIEEQRSRVKFWVEGRGNKALITES